MKRKATLVLSLICTLICAFALFACGDGDSDADNKDKDEKPTGVAVKDIELYPDKVEWTLNEEVKGFFVQATVYPENAEYDEISWSISDKNNVFMQPAENNTCYVEPHAPGEYKIAVRAGDVWGYLDIFVQAPDGGKDPEPDYGELNYELTEDGYSVIGAGTVRSDKLIVPATYKGVPVTSIGYGAFTNYGWFTEIEIPDSVVKIGNNAFESTTWFKNQPDGVVYVGKVAYTYKGDMPENTAIEFAEGTKGIADWAFYDHANLVEVTFPDGLVSIGSNAFGNCGITSITIPDSVTLVPEYQAASPFYGCKLESATIPAIAVDCVGVSDRLRTVVITGGDIKDYAFSGHERLENITVSDSVVKIGRNAFADTAWYDDQRSGIVYAGKVAYAYKGNMPANYTVSLAAGTKGVAGYAFYDRDTLVGINIPDSVVYIDEYAFFNCDSLASITVGAGNANYSSQDGILYDKAKTEMIYIAPKVSGDIILPDSLTSIPEYAFGMRFDLKSVVIGDNVESIGIGAFNSCSALESITVGAGNANYSSQGGILYNKDKTEILEVPYRISGNVVIPDGITTIRSHVFSDCQWIESIVIGDNVEIIEDRAFAYCYRLESITVGAGNANYCSQGGILYNKAKTEMLHVPRKISGDITVPDGVTSIAESAFYACSNIISVTLPQSVTEIGANSFDNCDKLETVVFPDGFDISHIEFNWCFSYNGALVGDHYITGTTLTGVKDGVTTVIVPSAVTTISANAFSNTAVKYVYIPETVTTIENGAFTDTSVEKLFYEGRALATLQNATYADIGSCTADGWIYTESGSGVSVRAYIGAGGEVAVPAQIDGKAVTTLSQEGGVGNVFLDRDDITKVTFTSAQIMIEAGTMANLTNLTEIAFGADVAAISMTKSAYDGCSDLAAISLAGGYDKYQLTTMEFSVGGGTPSMTTVDISDAADVLAKLNEADDDTTVCMIVLKEQAA